ncbi:hypothetical protein ACNOYE_02125 [Nannocystaceae bacterium ST9]
MPKYNNNVKVKPNHKFINIQCANCCKVYSRTILKGRKCPVDSTHKIQRAWGSIKQNVKFVNPDTALFKRPKRVRMSLRREVEHRRRIQKMVELDEFLTNQGFDDLDQDDVETEEDYDYAQPANFNPNMRYTRRTGNRRACRAWSSYGHLVTGQKSTGVVRIGNAVGRPCSPGAEMGAKVGNKAKSAQKWAGRGQPYKTNRYASLEWCHLQADSLGGPTTVGNLVAASFAANTEMLVIEHYLKGKTHLGIEVTAHCGSAHVAEFIEYDIYTMTMNGSTTHKFKLLIDARNDYFTEDDASDLRGELKDALK